MKGKRFILPITVFALLLSFGLSACNGGDNGGGNTPKSSQTAQQSIKITAADNKTKLILGETVQLTASIEGVSWSTSDAAIAEVSPAGLVTSKAVGKATIKASKEGYKDGSITINVDLPTIKVTASATSVVIGEKITVTADQQGVTWESSDANIASVNNAGEVTGVKAGDVTISAKKDGFNAGSVAIKVTRPAPTAILDLQYADHYAADGEWSSSGRGPIETPVYEKSNARDGICLAYFGDGDKETLTFTSNKAVKAELVLMIGYYYSIDDASTSFAVKFNNADVTIPANQPYEAEDTSNYTYKGLSLGDVNVIEGNNVLEITMKEGAQYHPYLDDVEVYAESAATLTVVPAKEKDPVTVNEESLTVAEGKTTKITSSLTGLTFKSNNTAIATVTDDGTVTGVKEGSTTITISKDGYKSIKIPVTVTAAEGVIAVSINSGTSEGDVVTFRTSQNLSEPFNYIVDAWPEGAVLTIKVANSGAAGKYNMYVRCRASGGYQSSTKDDLATCMEVKVNGNAVSASGEVSGNTFTDYLLGEVDLNTGENTVTIKCLTTVPTINMLRFLPKVTARSRKATPPT